MADLSPVTFWTTDDAAHLGRRAGFGLSPVAASALAGRPPPPAGGARGGGRDALFSPVVLDVPAEGRQRRTHIQPRHHHARDQLVARGVPEQ